MAFSRFFGKPKKDPPSPSGSNHSPDLSEREGDDNFTVVETKPPQPQPDFPPTYSSVSQLPYQLPHAGGGAAAAARPALTPQVSHPLEGVVFTLSPKLATDSEIDQMSLTVDTVMSRIKSLEWAAFDYNFSLERSILSSDLSLDGFKIN